MTNPVKRIQKWWHGHMYENAPDSRIAILYWVYPRPRIYWDKFKKHIEQHWQFWIGTGIAMLGLYFSISKQGG